ncbi:Minor extracellular protease Epr precursor [compost metagenome]
MKPELLIGIVDSGHGPNQAAVIAGRRFQLSNDGLDQGPLQADSLGHGSAVLAAIAQRAPAAQFCVAQVFDGRGVTSALQIATAIDWLIACKVRLINLSLGLRQDRELLRQACVAAQTAGILLCASSPAQGAAVYPASYPGVLRVTGDARCEAEQWSWLDSTQADFGACVRSDNPRQSGASLACAAFSGHVAAYWSQHPHADPRQVLAWLREHASYQGPERRRVP